MCGIPRVSAMFSISDVVFFCRAAAGWTSHDFFLSENLLYSRRTKAVSLHTAGTKPHSVRTIPRDRHWQMGNGAFPRRRENGIWWLMGLMKSWICHDEGILPTHTLWGDRDGCSN